MSIYNLLMELQTWFGPSQDIMDRAKESKITTKNNTRFKELVSGWTSGMYDEDPQLLFNRVCQLLN